MALDGVSPEALTRKRIAMLVSTATFRCLSSEAWMVERLLQPLCEVLGVKLWREGHSR